MTKKVYISIGLPASGKSTWAEIHLPGATIINADDIRGELYGDPMTQGNPKDVWAIHDLLVRSALLDPGVKTIAITNTSLVPSIRKQYYDLAEEMVFLKEVDAVEFVLVYFDVPLKTCLERNAARNRVVPEEVIIRMSEKITKPTVNEIQEHEVIYVR